MSNNGESSMTNGSAIDPMQRLSSFKSPRDLSLAPAKPNKKIFTPNLNVSRNKSKSSLPVVTKDKRMNDKGGKRDRKGDKNKFQKNGPNIIKSSGVFSEGIGATERSYRERMSYGRDGAEPTSATLQKPTLRVKDFGKIVDKELEAQKVRRAFGDAYNEDSDDDFPSEQKNELDTPVRLPLSDGGWLHSKPKSAIKAKQETIKQEPIDDPEGINLAAELAKVEVKKESFEDTDIVTLLQSDKPTLIMLQFPDTLPGRGKSEEEAPRKRASANDTTAAGSSVASEPVEDKPKVVAEERCRLADLEEGKVGKLIIHRSGRIRLALGDTIFEVSAGTQSSFRQEVVSVAVDDTSRAANLVSLGPIPHKLNLLPHWESLLAQCNV